LKLVAPALKLAAPALKLAAPGLKLAAPAVKLFIAAVLPVCVACGRGQRPVADARPSGEGGSAPLVVRVLDVGQGDATYIENGSSRVLIDGGDDARRLGAHLDRLQLNGDTIDLVIISHGHFDHYNGLSALFASARAITIRYLFESRDISPNVTLISLRDSILARAQRGELVYRDSDDPCSDSSPICTVFLDGGAKLHIMRPYASGDGPNNRSTPVKLVGPDSASFTMWFSGDAERDAVRWFDDTDYDVNPGMKVNVLKGNHHGSCNGTTRPWLELLNPDAIVFSLAAQNEYGHVHSQTTALLASMNVPWYRTDQNGEVVITSPGTAGGGYTIQVERGVPNALGPSDRNAAQSSCGRG
jgi:competence protein ComEC